MLQQLSGINALIYYSTAVFGAAGLASPVIGTVLLAVVNLLGEDRRASACGQVSVLACLRVPVLRRAMRWCLI